mgnify:CR=1 FL=1
MQTTRTATASRASASLMTSPLPRAVAPPDRPTRLFRDRGSEPEPDSEAEPDLEAKPNSELEPDLGLDLDPDPNLNPELDPDPDLETRLARLTAARGPLRRTLARLTGRLVETQAIERLGFARLGDYARERLGLSARKLQELARIDRALADLPSLEASLCWNVLPWCKVRLIARIATPETVDGWIERARALPTRRLEAAVREEARGRPVGDAVRLDLEADDPERQRWIRLRCSPAVREKWSLVRELVERVAGQRLGDGEAFELVVAEAFSTFSIDPELVRSDVSGVGSRADGRAGSGLRWGVGNCADGASSVASPIQDQGESRGASPQKETDKDSLEWEEVTALLRDLEDADAFELDRRLQRAVHLEQILDATIAPLLRRMRDVESGSSEQETREAPQWLSASTCEALGMSARKVRSLLRLERAGDVCPELRRAYRAGDLSWVKAQGLLPLLMLDDGPDGQPGGLPNGPPGHGPDVVSDASDGRSDEEPDSRTDDKSDGASEGDEQGEQWKAAWVAWAQQVTVRRLTEDVERALVLRAAHDQAWSRCKDHPERVWDPIPTEERQVCAPGIEPGETERLRWWVPVEVALLYKGVRDTLRRRLEFRQERPVTDGEVFEGLLDEALRSWTLREPGRRKPDPVIERDGYRCAVPGCSSRRNLENHHIVFRSRGGSDASWNRVMLCAFHHHRGVHTARARVRGRAPDGLVFELGMRGKGEPALVGYRSGDVLMGVDGVPSTE